MKKRLLCIILCALLLLSSCGITRKKVDFSYFNDNFNPFSVIGNTNLSAVALTQAYILTKQPDKSDSAQSYIDYYAHSNGVGIADITVAEAEDSSYVDYTVKLGDNVKFSNGDPVTAKDVAFSLYVYCDIDYNGWAQVDQSFIDGLAEYRYGNSEADEIVFNDDQIENELKYPSDKTKEYIRELIVLPVLEEEYRWVEHLYTDPAYEGTEADELIKTYPDVNDLFAYYYSLDQNYTPADDKDTLISDIADQFGADYETLSVIYGSDLSTQAEECARRALTEAAVAGMRGETVTSIRGITIVDDKTLTVRLTQTAEEYLENALGVFVLPFSVYGKNCSFDGVGFDIDIESVLDPTLEPIGAGPCVFKGYKAGEGVKLSANKHYFRDPGFEQNVMLVETGDSLTARDDTYFTVYEERLVVSE